MLMQDHLLTASAYEFTKG